MSQSNKNYYKGSWKGNFREGYGEEIEYLDDGTFAEYEGSWKKNLKDGKGKRIYSRVIVGQTVMAHY